MKRILFIIVLLVSLCLTLGSFLLVVEGDASPSPAGPNLNLSPAGTPFSSPEQEMTFVIIHECHRAWMDTVELFFSSPPFIGAGDQGKDTMAFFNATKADIDQQQAEALFGKEFFSMFMQYHQDRADGLSKFLAKDMEGARVSLGKAKTDAEQLKRFPMKNKDLVSDLFVDKMVLEVAICLGATECARGKTDAGIAALRAAGEEAARIKWYWGKAQAAYYMAVYAQWAKLPSAKALAQNALEIAREYRIHHFIWKCCLMISWTNTDDQFLETRISLLEEAVMSIDFMRVKEKTDFEKRYFMSDKIPTYQTLIQDLLKKGDIRKALEVSEAEKSRVLQDFLDAAYSADVHGGRSNYWYIREQVLSENIESLEGTPGKEAESRLGALRQEYENVLHQIRQNNPDFGVLKVGGSADVDDIQALLDEKTVLLEYNPVQDGQRLIAWLVTKNSVRIENIPIDPATLAQNIQAIRMMIGKPKSPAAYKLLGQLYEAIIKPFEKEIQGKNLIIVPDGVLNHLPFAALMDAKGKFLVENHTISIEPAFTVLQYCMAKKKGDAKTILAFGNPDLQDAKMDLPNTELEVKNIVEHFPKWEPSLMPRGDAKADLPNAQMEVKNIAGRFPQTQAYLRKEATETIAKKIMGNYDIIHFACHGEQETGDAMYSCVRLAPDDSNDGKLTVSEIFKLRLNAQLVILSGCETGRVDLRGGSELLGLTRSLLYAGAACVVVSLWKVDDNATFLLMGKLYENLAKMGKAEALRQAQIEMMKTKKHPYYWAAFYLVGDGR